MEIPFDKYTYRARLLPTLIVCAPVAFAAAVWFPDDWERWKPILVIFISFGITALLPQLGRDLGKEREPGLFRSWGGPPTRLLLSHRSSRLDRITLTRYHAKLSALLPDLIIPTAADEARNPTEASKIYDSCVLYLRENTHDSKKFPLVLAENINYGFRRNLWASKTIGLFLAGVGTTSCVLFIVMRSAGSRTGLPFAVGGAIICAGLVFIWARTIGPAWVRLPAEAYAERLVGTLDTL
jgi:hypothetical protein